MGAHEHSRKREQMTCDRPVRDRVSPGAVRLAFLCAALTAFCTLLAAPSAQASFGISSFSAAANNENETPDLRAGSHPFAYTIHLGMNLDGQEEPEGTLYSLALDLPQGFYGNPQAIPTCQFADFDTGIEPSCPARSQIGIVHADAPGLPLVLGLYNLKPPPGALAAFGFGANGTNLVERLTLAADSSVRVSAPILPGLGLQSITETIWGVPAASSHNPDRICIDPEGPPIQGCSTDAERAPLLTLPTSCERPLLTTITLTSTEQPAIPQTASVESLGEGGGPEGLHGCEGLPFDPEAQRPPRSAGALALRPSRRPGYPANRGRHVARHGGTQSDHGQDASGHDPQSARRPGARRLFPSPGWPRIGARRAATPLRRRSRYLP